MEEPKMIIRIMIPDADPMDWTVNPTNLTFRATLELLQRLLPQTTCTAFEYEDEDSDRITVRSEDEMSAMISHYINTVLEAQARCSPYEPLVIFPRTCKAPSKRNIHGLKVQTGPPNSYEEMESSPGEKALTDGSSKQEQRDIQEIMACGQICSTDLRHVEILGTGTGGTVYKAQHRPSSTTMAVKVIPLDITEEVRKQILSELQILYQCHSPYIIAFYGAFFVENQISMCTEFMDGGSLDQYGQVPEAVLGRMAVSVVKGLHYLWNLKIMHRDVKPSNILVNTIGQVKLCDFGVSVQLVNSITKTYVGTNAYMAPERIVGEGYSIHSEIWSLGISLFEMAIGKYPYDTIAFGRNPCDKTNSGGQLLDVMKAVVGTNPPILPRGVFSDAMVDFVAKCMQKDPKKRPSLAALLHHPCIVRNDDGKTNIIAHWVSNKLEEIELRKIGHKQSSA